MKLKYLYLPAVAALLALNTACSDEDHNLAAPDVTPEELVEGIAFSITHDSENPNIVYLKSLLPASYQVAWETPQGRSVGSERTLRIPFDGSYEIRMGVNTRGGYVWSEPADFTIDDFCASFVDHFLWTRISGGVGQSKTWQLDLAVLEDGSNKTTFWKGPHWFFNTNYTWDHLHAASENETTYANYMDSDPWEKSAAINPADVPTDANGNEANWYWAADYAGNSWMCAAQNYGYITFDLINGANVTITDADGNVVSKGSYMLDVDNHTLTLSDCYPLETTDGRTHERFLQLLYLSNDAMQLLAPSQGVALNYVTKDYFENYVENTEEPEPSLPDGWKDDISQTVITSVKWVLSDQNPLDWANLDGSLMNNWKTPADYPDWLGTPDPASYAGFSMTLDSKDNSATFAYPDGTVLECTYELDDKGIYTFSEAVPSFSLVGWASFAVDGNNALRITSIEKDPMGNISGMWLGARDAVKPEYMAYHFTPSAGSSSAADPMEAWKKALCGKTFTPNTNAFCDWVNFDLSGGLTPPSSFGDDYSSNGWIWNADVAQVAKSASLTFTDANGQIMAALSYTKFDGTQVNESGVVTINNDTPSLKLPFPLIDYTGTAASWLPTTNEKGANWTTPLASDEWIWLSHSIVGNNLSNIDTNGFWLAGVINATSAGDDKDELIAYWWKVKE